MLTYGDGVSNVDIKALVDYHKRTKKLCTLTSIQVPGRFGSLDIQENGSVYNFMEKPQGDGLWINGGFFVMEPGIFNYLTEDNIDEVQWEKGPLEKIAKDGKLGAYKHHGFWKCMDALRDRIELENLWNTNQALWKLWS
jgi:glucose-1-phosphate cytidylyltransferase